ncbi:MAG: ATP phosphoribosyltransferase regulatory subunit [Candidatus Dormibacteraeota bacterium]|nr:ATP phosphoribosyltransferase regulatory subunit [Candidatus Dormibacteraeota bacterium]
MPDPLDDLSPLPEPLDAPDLPDLVPDAAEAMRATQESVLAEMRGWGYHLVATPTLERVETLAQGLDADEIRRLFKLTDRDGSVLAVVGERTIPVARLVGGRLRTVPFPMRLCYAGTVLTNDVGRFTHHREWRQAGAELLGAAGPVADAEVIALAARCLRAAGLDGWQVDVGHAEFFLGLLDGIQAEHEVKQSIRAVLATRDFVALEHLLDRTPLRSAEHELLLRFPGLRGGPEILDAAANLVTSRRSARALEELATVHRLLQAYDLGDALRLDLGAIRDFEYYTGVILEAYLDALGRPLVQGGRYDHLLARFGRPAPATGFVLNLDLVGDALRQRVEAPALTRLDAVVAWSRAGLEGALRLGATLRLFGLRAIVATEPQSLSVARSWALSAGARDLLHVGAGDSVRWVDPRGTVRRIAERAVVAELLRSRT